MTDHSNEGLPGASRVGVMEGHEYVDLGLGVLWAACNVGAASQYDPGLYFAWGETEPKDGYTPENYKAGEKNRLEPADDPAHVHWGGNWRLPSPAELVSLIRACEWDYHRTEDGRPYYRVTSKTNGNSIVLPLAGCWDAQGPQLESEKGHLWLNASLEPGFGLAPCLRSYYIHMWESNVVQCAEISRYLGVPVRPVASAPKPISRPPEEDDLKKSMPKLIRLALERNRKEADVLLGYRMVLQRKAVPGDAAPESLLEEEIRLVDGSVFTRPAEGEFEHAFLQLCLPLVHHKFRTDQLPGHESHVSVDGIDRERYWNCHLFDIVGGEGEALRCLEWLREWIDRHRDATRILDPDRVADDMRKEGRRVPVKMHICYKDVPDSDGWCTPELARGHQDMVAWKNEESLERAKPYYSLTGELGGYGDDVLVAAKMRLDETLGMDCDWLKISAGWADGEFERIMEGRRPD